MTDELTKVVNPCLSVCGPGRSVQLRTQVSGADSPESTSCVCHIVAMARNHEEGIIALPGKLRTEYEILSTRPDRHHHARSTQ